MILFVIACFSFNLFPFVLTISVIKITEMTTTEMSRPNDAFTEERIFAFLPVALLAFYLLPQLQNYCVLLLWNISDLLN